MPRRFRPWWTPTAAVSLALLGMLAGGTGAAESPDEGRAAGLAAGALVRERFGTPEALRDHLLNPMTAPETPLETLDGSRSFGAQLSFPSSAKFLEVFMQPGPSGDLATVLLSADLDFDGTADYSYRVPLPVSGVCGNGVISCLPGSWSECRHYRWRADASGRVALEDSDILNLGGCYCINNDCGQDLVWRNPAVVLNDLGGGVVGALQQANPGFTLSDVRTTATTIAYYGQDTGRQAPPPGTPAAPPRPPAQTAYFDNPAEMAGAAVAATRQPGVTGDLAGQITELAERSGTSGQVATCSIARSIRIDQVQGYCQDIVGEVLSSVRDRRFYRLRTGGGTYTIRGSLPPESVLDQTFNADPPPYNQFSLKDYACNLTYAKDFFAGRTPVPAEVRDGSAGPITDTTAIPADGFYLGRSVDYAWFDNDDSGCNHDDIGFYVHDWHEVCTHVSDVATDLFQDSCAVLEDDPDCTLRSEEVDDVITYREFNPTGLTPLPSTRFFPGVTAHEVTRDWWRKERSYVCGGQGYDFAEVKSRYGAVIGSLRENGEGVDYQDQRLEEGAWVAASGEIEMMPLPVQDDCEKACKTRRPTRDSRAVLPGHSGQLKTDTASYDILYHACVDGRCPAGPDEEILKDCQCLNEFAEAASMMQMLRLAGQDTLCSDGRAK